MSINDNDIYKACIGAPDNFMSTYYYTEFKKFDEARKKERERITRSDNSFGSKTQRNGNKDIFGFDTLNKPKTPEKKMTKEEQEKFDEGAKAVFVLLLGISIFYLLVKFLVAAFQAIGSFIN